MGNNGDPAHVDKVISIKNYTEITIEMQETGKEFYKKSFTR
jgi:hypothetical protein